MYLSHFKLQEKPFNTNPDPKFLWFGERLKGGLARLKSGILNGRGHVVVTGDVGTGKTVLAGALVDDLRDQITIAEVDYPHVDPVDFLKLILTSYGLHETFQDRTAFLACFESFLRASVVSGKKPVLVIDEAQRLTPANLDALLHLSILEENGMRLLQLVLVGQNEFRAMLQEERNRGLREQVTTLFTLQPLSMEETRDYLLHRLRVARCEREIFTSDALQEIFLFSGGVPRLINVVSDLSLLVTYLEGGPVVSREHVRRCLERLRLPGENGAGVRTGAHRPSRMKNLGRGSGGHPDPEHDEPDVSKGRARNLIVLAIVLLVALSGFLLYDRQNESFEEGGGNLVEKDPVPSVSDQGFPRHDTPLKTESRPETGKSVPDVKTVRGDMPPPVIKEVIRGPLTKGPEEAEQGTGMDRRIEH